MDLLAAIVSSCKAWLAFVADDVGFDSNTVSDLEMCHRRMDFQYNTRRFVPKNMCVFDNHRSYAASVPEVNIGTDEVLALLPVDLTATYPQIPVLLIPTVTSPGFKLSPF